MKQKGFTLVEIILSIGLVAILFASTAIILDRGFDSYADITKRGAKHQEVRFAMERMVRELILLEAGPSGELNGIQSDRVQFRDALGTNTDFRLNGNTLNRGSDPLLENVTAFIVTGYRDNNQVTTSAPQVRRIRLQVSALPEGQSVPVTFRTDVFLRTDMYENFQ